jgi:ribose transport system permease protein
VSNIVAETSDTHGRLAGNASVGHAARRRIARSSVIASMLVVFLVFCVLRPSSFFTQLTIESIFRDSTPLFIVALGLTFVLVVDDFDLSAGGLVALCSTFVAMMMSTQYLGLNLWVAILLTLALGAVAGLVNGILIAYFRVPSIIWTIAMATVYAGIGLQLTNSSPIFEGIPGQFNTIISGTVFGLSRHVLIGLVLLVLAHVFLRHTTSGRYLYAIGGNPEASRLAGVRVDLQKCLTYVVVGLTAAVTAVLLTSEAGAANPNTGLGLLLPAYAAAFLGSSMFRPGLFTPIGTALGAVYLQVIGTGLTILNLSGPIVQIVQGAILGAAVLLARGVK